MKDNDLRKKRIQRKRIRIIILSLIIVLLLGCGGYFFSRTHLILNNPRDLFKTKADIDTNVSSSQIANGSDSALTQEGNDTQDGIIDSPNESSSLVDDDIVNVLLLGIDRTPNGKTSSGTMAHADAIMVVAINFVKNEVNLVSLPRDSFVNMPDVKGFYKLNCLFNVGGGYEDKNGGGFTKMCEASQWLLGGIPIDYYYSVDFEAVMELVDAIGGVDYEMDMDYTGTSGTDYQRGEQHLDGLGVLDYLRARRNATQGANDRERVNRQKRMMIAIFKQMKKSNLLKSLPSMLNSVKKGFYTNTSIEQTLAIANYARKFNPDSIGTYSLYGEYKAGPIAWNWTFVDPENRIEVIQKVWGVTVSPLECTSYEFMTWLKDFGFLALKYKSTAELIVKAAEDMPSLDTEQQTAYDELLNSYNKLATAYDVASHSLINDDTYAMKSDMDDLRLKARDLAKKINYQGRMEWYVLSPWCEDIGINEIYVDFA